MEKFLDPIANAKALGAIYIVLGVLSLVGTIFNPFVIISSIILFVTGYGLWKTKRWALYLVGLNLILAVLAIFITQKVNVGSIAINALIFWVIYRGRDKFKN